MAKPQRTERQSPQPDNRIPHPPIAAPDQWLLLRKKLLRHEKELTKHYDRINAERRRLPMVKIDRDYTFDGPGGRRDFKALFEGRRQLIIYHFMFDPAWEKGCPSCTWYIDSLGDLSMLSERTTTLALVSRAPLAKLEAYRKERGWEIPWYSSFGSDFNYDFQVTSDPKVRPPQYNYRNKAENEAHDSPNNLLGEEHGLSVFFTVGDEVFHTYSAYARGTEHYGDARMLLDATPYGRQEEFEDSPPGWPQRPTYG